VAQANLPLTPRRAARRETHLSGSGMVGHPVRWDRAEHPSFAGFYERPGPPLVASGSKNAALFPNFPFVSVCSSCFPLLPRCLSLCPRLWHPSPTPKEVSLAQFPHSSACLCLSLCPCPQFPFIPSSFACLVPGPLPPTSKGRFARLPRSSSSLLHVSLPGTSIPLHPFPLASAFSPSPGAPVSGRPQPLFLFACLFPQPLYSGPFARFPLSALFLFACVFSTAPFTPPPGALLPGSPDSPSSFYLCACLFPQPSP